MNEEEHVRVHGYPADAKVAIYTGLGKKGRNVILVRSARICVFLAGGMGTLNEFTIAHDELSEKCVIAVLSGSGGFSDEYLRLAESSRRKTRAALIAAHDPEELVHKSVQELFR
jgi:predicted Rossmann-fold nucleotide-binding protein